MKIKRNQYRKPIPLQLISFSVEPEQAKYLWKRAADNGKSDSQIIREAIRKFIEHYDNLASKGRSINFQSDIKGSVVITGRIPIDLLADLDSIFKANKKDLNRSLGVRIGLDNLMKKPIKL